MGHTNESLILAKDQISKIGSLKAMMDFFALISADVFISNCHKRGHSSFAWNIENARLGSAKTVLKCHQS
jgi:hypothetical protein